MSDVLGTWEIDPGGDLIMTVTVQINGKPFALNGVVGHGMEAARIASMLVKAARKTVEMSEAGLLPEGSTK